MVPIRMEEIEKTITRWRIIRIRKSIEEFLNIKFTAIRVLRRDKDVNRSIPVWLLIRKYLYDSILFSYMMILVFSDTEFGQSYRKSMTPFPVPSCQSPYQYRSVEVFNFPYEEKLSWRNHQKIRKTNSMIQISHHPGTLTPGMCTCCENLNP